MASLSKLLFELADEHEGVFSAGEAAQAGISHPALVMAAGRGTIIQLSRGIYRLANYPVDQDKIQLWEAVLWPTVDRGTSAEFGVLSHLTALRLNYTLLDFTPDKISITIQPSVRIRRKRPLWLEVHKGRLHDDDVTSIGNGLPVTTLERTLFDCIKVGVDRRLIEQVLKDGRSREPLPDALSDETLSALRAAMA